MEFLKLSQRRTFISELVYILLNVALAVGVLVLVLAVDSPYAALGLVLLSKWRVFAVRPRYWFANLQANLVDIIVGVSVVALLFVASDALVAQIILTLLYAGWLLAIKPRSNRFMVSVQAGVMVFIGVTALMTVAYGWSSSITVLGMWLIGYSAARHVLLSYDEAHTSFYSLVWGLVIAELGWLTYHWSFAYALPGAGGVQLVQAAIIALAISFFAEQVYASYVKHGAIRSSDVLMPALLSSSLILVLVIFFSRVGDGSL